ncbi:MAG: hypothetical protein VX762_01040 [Bacteroidota bacterium]|nr:hypothetical protein [Bacteroidota bacterium]
MTQKIGFKTKKQLKKEKEQVQKTPSCPSEIGQDKYEYLALKMLSERPYHYSNGIKEKFEKMRQFMIFQFPEASLDVKFEMLTDFVTIGIAYHLEKTETNNLKL